MGSLDKACIAGFLCRLCSEMHRTVIHIYGEKGRHLGLAQKINDYLPVTITPTDPLPKTICESCMGRVEQHHDLMVRMTKSRVHFGQLRQVRMSLHRYSTNSPSEASSVEVNSRVPRHEVRRRTSQPSHNNVNQTNDDDDGDDDDDASSNDSDENI